MKARCGKKTDKNYGGRGISVCDRWLNSFEAFLEDMGERQKGTTLERIDNDGNYCPENCKWATMPEQSRNRRTCVFASVNGEKLTIADWARKLKVSPFTIYSRINKFGDSPEAAVTRYMR
jgi:hypothetical protein